MEAETVVDAAASLLEADVVALAVADVAATLTLALPRQCSPWEALCMLLRARCSASQPMPSTSHTLTPPSTWKTNRRLEKWTKSSARSTKCSSQ